MVGATFETPFAPESFQGVRRISLPSDEGGWTIAGPVARDLGVMRRASHASFIIALRNHAAALIAGYREAARLRYELTLLKVRAEHAEANFLEIVLSQKGGETK